MFYCKLCKFYSVDLLCEICCIIGHQKHLTVLMLLLEVVRGLCTDTGVHFIVPVWMPVVSPKSS